MQNRIDEIFWGQTFKNTPYFNLRPPYFWKLLTCGYVAAGAFSSTHRGPIFLEAPNLWVRCRRRFFFLHQTGPICLEAPSLWVRCRRRFFSPEKWPPYFWKQKAPNLWVRCRRRLFFHKKGAPCFWKPLTCGYVAAGAFFLKKRPQMFGSP